MANWFDEAGGFEWLRTVPGTPASQNGYDRLERLYRINKDPGKFTYEALESALDRGTSRSWRDDPSGQSFVNDWLARRQGAVASAQAAAANNGSNPNPLAIDPKRGTGEYGDIIDSLKSELGTAQQTIADIQSRQVNTPQTPSVQDQMSEVLSQMKLDFQQRYSALQDMMLQQQQSYQSSMTTLQQQAQAAQAAYQQQLQLSQNMAKAYVPPAEQTAATAATGDQRTTQTRQVRDNALSELSVLSGLGTNANPLSGLQLA